MNCLSMVRAIAGAAALGLVASACGDDGGGGGLDAGPPDAGPPMIDAGPDWTTIEIAQPLEELVYATEQVDFIVDVEGRAPRRVDLLRDGLVLAVLEDPYFHTWDLEDEEDGAYQIVARALIGDDELITTRTIRVVVDRSIPEVIGEIPEAGSEAFDMSAPIIVDLSEVVDPDTVTDAAIRVVEMGGEELPVNVSVGPEGYRLLGTLEEAPETLPATLEVTVGEGVADFAGNEVVASAWTYGVPAWLPLGDFYETLSRDSQFIDAMVDSAGRPTMAYIAGVDVAGVRTDHVRVARLEEDGSWRDLCRELNRNPRGHAGRALLEEGPGGQLYAAWAQQVFVPSGFIWEIEVARYAERDRLWVPVGQSVAVTDGDARFFRFAVAAGGQPTIIVRSPIPGTSDAEWAGYRLAGDEWQRFGSPIVTSVSRFGADLAADDDGVLHAIIQTPGLTYSYYRWSGASWVEREAPVGQANSTAPINTPAYPRLVFVEGTPAVLGWRGTDVFQVALVRDDDAYWRIKTRSVNPVAQSSVASVYAVDGEGTEWAADGDWINRGRAWRRGTEDGALWTLTGTFEGTHPRLGFDPEGRPVVVTYERRTSDEDRVRGYRWNRR